MYSFDSVLSDKISALANSPENFIPTTHVSEQSSTPSQPLPINTSTPGISCDLPPVRTESLSTPESSFQLDRAK